jgi:hypothetical protein
MRVIQSTGYHIGELISVRSRKLKSPVFILSFLSHNFQIEKFLPHYSYIPSVH